MSRMIKTSVCLAVLGAASAHMYPVNVDMDKLTDFTAKFSVDTATVALDNGPDFYKKMLPVLPILGMLPGLAFHGSIQADVGGERCKITLHGVSALADPFFGSTVPTGAHQTGSAELIFDGPGGFVSYRVKADDTIPSSPGVNSASFKIDLCAKVNFPKGLLPSGQMIKSQIVQMKPKLEQQLTMAPHTDATVDGERVAIYSSEDQEHPPPAIYSGVRPATVYVGIKNKDGTPLGAGVMQPTGGTWTPFIRFTQWTHGAGEISEIQCTQGLDSTSLAADRHAAVHMQAFDRVMASLKGAEELDRVFAAFPAEPSLIFKSSGCAATALEEKRATSSSLFPTVAVAVAAGALGGLVSFFFAFVKGTSKANRVALISDDA